MDKVKVRTNVYLEPEVRDRAQLLADWMDLSFSEFVNFVINEYLNRSFVMGLLDREIMGIEED